MFLGDGWLACFAFFLNKNLKYFIAYDTENGGTQTIANFHDNEIDSFGSGFHGFAPFFKARYIGLGVC